MLGCQREPHELLIPWLDLLMTLIYILIPWPNINAIQVLARPYVKSLTD